MRELTHIVWNVDTLNQGFLRVQANHGGPGVDGVTVDVFGNRLSENLAYLARELQCHAYSPLPLLKILVDKGNGEARDLCIPAVRDRVAQTAALHAIEPVLENDFEDCSFGYRKGRSVKQAVYRIKECYEQGYRWVVEADVDNFFDTVDRAILIEKVQRYIIDADIVRLIKMWVAAEVWDGKSISVLERGIPQGSPISPILANLFLDELDDVLLKHNQKLVRFADDFVVLCKSAEKAKEALEFTDETLEKLCLTLGESEVVDFDHGFKFLGVTFVRSLIMVPFDKPKKERKILYYPPPLNMTAYYQGKTTGGHIG